MSDDAPQVPDTLTGRCMCGAATYKITEKPMVAGLSLIRQLETGGRSPLPLSAPGAQFTPSRMA